MHGKVIWITGLSGAGKTTVATALNQHLKKYGLNPILLDGDNLRNLFNGKVDFDNSYCREERIILSKNIAYFAKTFHHRDLQSLLLHYLCITKFMLGTGQTCRIILKFTWMYLWTSFSDAILKKFIKNLTLVPLIMLQV